MFNLSHSLIFLVRISSAKVGRSWFPHKLRPIKLLLRFGEVRNRLKGKLGTVSKYTGISSFLLLDSFMSLELILELGTVSKILVMGSW